MRKLLLLFSLSLSFPCFATSPDAEYYPPEDIYSYGDGAEELAALKDPIKKEFSDVRAAVFVHHYIMLSECAENDKEACETSAQNFIEKLSQYKNFLRHKAVFSTLFLSPTEEYSLLKKYILKRLPLKDALQHWYRHDQFRKINTSSWRELIDEMDRSFGVYLVIDGENPLPGLMINLFISHHLAKSYRVASIANFILVRLLVFMFAIKLTGFYINAIDLVDKRGPYIDKAVLEVIDDELRTITRLEKLLMQSTP